jgi:hypothetical protein
MTKYYKYIMLRVAIKFSIFFLISCNGDDFNQKNDALKFYVDNSLLADSIFLENSNVLLRPPLGWEPISEIDFEKLSKSIKSEDNIFDIHLSNTYRSIDGALMIISSIQSKADNFGYIPIDYKELLIQQFSTEDIYSLKLSINQISVLQYLINTDKFVIIRIFISSNPNYQIDYIIPRNIYEKELMKIESSIGSIIKKTEDK